MLQTILVPVSIVTGTGLIAGLLLSIASKFFAVKVDETVANLPVGGAPVAAKLGEILGVSVGDIEPKRAVVKCRGHLQTS